MIASSLIATPLETSRRRPLVRPLLAPGRGRVFHIMRVIGGFAAFALWARLRRRANPRALGEDLRRRFELLGGVWIKLGQILSMRVDLFPADFCDAFVALQDQADAFPGEVAREIVAEALERPLEDVFTAFDPVPFAAASIGQLHRARLRLGEREVAVKVRRPHIEARVRGDLRLIGGAMRLFSRLRRRSTEHLEEFFAELERSLEEELDYRYEASSMKRMRRSLRGHRHVHVPKVYRRHSTDRVLVMEYVPGAMMADLLRAMRHDPARARMWLYENNIDPELVARRLVRSVFRQVFEDNLFHGDLHPGNIILLRDSKFVLIDFGVTGSFDADVLHYAFANNDAMIAGEYARAADLILLTRPNLPATDLEPYRAAAVRLMRDFELRAHTYGLEFEQKSAARLAVALARAEQLSGIPANWQFLRLIRTRLTIEVSLRVLAPNLNHHALTRSEGAAVKRRLAEEHRRAHPPWVRRARLLVRASRLAAVSSEHRLLETEWMRRRARILAPTVSKLDALAVGALNFGVTAVALAVVAAVGFWFHRPAGQLDGVLGVGVDIVSRLPAWVGVGAALLVGLLLYRLLQLRSGSRQPRPDLARRME